MRVLPQSERPLDGLTVVDFSQFLSGPLCALKLADLGARVIKIERPGVGDLCRHLYLSDTDIDGDNSLFHAINRNKESYTADLKSPDDVEKVRRLIARADVVIQSFRPGVIERLGLDYASVKELNPRAVYASVSGYGSAKAWDGKRDEIERPFVCIEYGMQTMHDETAWRVNRAHSHAETVEAVELTRRHAPDAHLCLHLIAGLPGEDVAMIRQSIDECARLAPDSVKFHHCYVYENTAMAGEFERGDFEVLTLEQHVGLAADCIERMPPHTWFQRLVGEISDSGVVAPQFGRSKMQIYQMISDELKRRGTYQGVRWAG